MDVAGQHGLGGEQQLGEVFPFADEAHGAGLQASRGELRRILPGQDQDLGVQLQGLQAGYHFETVDLGDADVQDGQVGRLLAGYLQGFGTVVGLADDGETVALEQQAHGQADSGMIIDDQHLTHANLL